MAAFCRLLIIFMLIGFAGSTNAQDVPSEYLPLVEQVMIAPDKFVWSIDGTTLLFETETHQAFAYEPTANKLSELDQSPFTLTLTEAEQADLQAAQPEVFKSPYGGHVLYQSSLSVRCGFECDGTLIMAGDFDTPICPDNCFYQPLDIQGKFDPRWSRDGSTALIHNISDTGTWENWFYVDLSDLKGIYIDTLDAYESQFYAISDDGKRVLYRNPIPKSDSDLLMLWTIESYASGSRFDSNTLRVISTRREKNYCGSSRRGGIWHRCICLNEAIFCPH